MNQHIPPELKKLKEKFDFLNKEIGELFWKKATLRYYTKLPYADKNERIDQQILNYQSNMNMLLDEIEQTANDLRMQRALNNIQKRHTNK